MQDLGKAPVGTIGLILAAAMAAGLLHFALGAALSYGAAVPAFRGVPSMQRPYYSPPLLGSGFVAFSGWSDTPVIVVVQQLPYSAAVSRPTETTINKTYVQPRWVDGGFGVEVLAPGQWIDPKEAATR